MKKIILSLIALVAMTTAASAQQQNDQQRQRMNPAEMVKQRTDRMVETYKLNDEQAAKLRELNEDFFKNMRQMGQRAPRGERNDSTAARPQRPQRQQGDNAQRGGDRPRGNAMMENYDNKLKEIMTEEQYAAYKQDMDKMRQNRRPGNGFGGQRRPQQQQ